MNIVRALYAAAGCFVAELVPARTIPTPAASVPAGVSPGVVSDNPPTPPTPGHPNDLTIDELLMAAKVVRGYITLLDMPDPGACDQLNRLAHRLIDAAREQIPAL